MLSPVEEEAGEERNAVVGTTDMYNLREKAPAGWGLIIHGHIRILELRPTWISSGGLDWQGKGEQGKSRGGSDGEAAE